MTRIRGLDTPKESKFFPVRLNPFSEGDKTFSKLFPLKVYSFALSGKALFNVGPRVWSVMY